MSWGEIMYDILMEAFRYAGMSVRKIMLQPLNQIKRLIIKFTSLKIIINVVMSWVRDGVKGIISGGKTSLKDYVSFRRFYIAKKLIFAVALGLILFSVVYIKFLHPIVYSFVTRNFVTPVFVINEPDMADYSGYAKLKHQNNEVIYAGEIRDGHVDGEGVLYDEQGRLLYRGMFLMDVYSGTGELYYLESGRTKYKGDFLYNKYDGSGILFYEDGARQYEGNFKGNQFDGYGELYYKEGTLMYKGGFVLGEFNGKGIFYDENSVVLYDGDFSMGRKNGYGVLYENGGVKYAGEFEDGLYNGAGKEYDSLGNLIYEGNYIRGEYNGYGKQYEGKRLKYEGTTDKGVYEGKGKLYNRDYLEYDGDFLKGNKNGTGMLYEKGEIIYSGGFKEDLYSGEGTLYDIETGQIIYKGGFSQGIYSGEGILYNQENGLTIYKGDFSEGKYGGNGKLYNDKEQLIYDGGFSEGNAEGDGTEYDSEGFIVYEGGFREGLYEGSGKLYDREVLLYQGEFLKGQYNGDGTLFNTATGFPIFEGKFINGEYMQNGTEFDEKGNPAKEKPKAGEDYLKMKYDDVKAYLTENSVEYQERALESDYIMTVSKNLLLQFIVDKDGVPVSVRSVYICGKDGYMGVYPGMKLSDAQEVLGEGTDIQDMTVTPQLSMALSISNVDSLGLVDMDSINSMSFEGLEGGKQVNVYYQTVEEQPVESAEPVEPAEPAEEETKEPAPIPVYEHYVLFVEVR